MNKFLYLLNESSSLTKHSEIQNFTSKIFEIFDNISSKEDFHQSAVNLLYIQSFYNITEKDLIKVSMNSSQV